ncbi:hypothetical protein [Nitrosomonas sp.]|uniref:hypothetical protein n=1 Tax=Nitrosomonas sp. TaxID=42353 RepID=UPI002720488D|nr:hypothetical protein [Nitrosomonas sp.]MDO8893974.1 hypothetical protein [Nitrosomonas sp.]
MTTSQGIQLFSNAGIRRFYRGIVRNVEQTDEKDLPEADTRIADVEAKNTSRFFERLQKATCFLLHLSEGVDETANKHFQSLRIADEKWAINQQLAGIHCAGLKEKDFDILGKEKGAMIWSPMSNLLLLWRNCKDQSSKRGWGSNRDRFRLVAFGEQESFGRTQSSLVGQSSDGVCVQ